MENIVIWGAKVKGAAVFSLLDESVGGNYRVLCFIDSNPELIGKELCGKLVRSPAHLTTIDKETKVLIASTAFLPIWYELSINGGFKNVMEAGKFVMYDRYSPQFPLCMKHIWNSDRTNADYEDGREDLIVEAIFKAIGIEKPKYMDIGARNTIGASNTYLFYQKGASGMAIDPLPTYVKEWAETRPRDKFLNIAISSVPADNVPFYTTAEARTGSSTITGISYQASLRKMQYETIYVKQDVFNNVAERDVQYVDIDTDGVDMEILTSIDFDLFPGLVCISIEQKGKECLDYMKNKGFTHFLSNCVNSIFIRDSIVEKVFADKLCSEIYMWHKIWLLIQDKTTSYLPL